VRVLAVGFVSEPEDTVFSDLFVSRFECTFVQVDLSLLEHRYHLCSVLVYRILNCSLALILTHI